MRNTSNNNKKISNHNSMITTNLIALHNKKQSSNVSNERAFISNFLNLDREQRSQHHQISKLNSKFSYRADRVSVSPVNSKKNSNKTWTKENTQYRRIKVEIPKNPVKKDNISLERNSLIMSRQNNHFIKPRLNQLASRSLTPMAKPNNRNKSANTRNISYNKRVNTGESRSLNDSKGKLKKFVFKSVINSNKKPPVIEVKNVFWENKITRVTPDNWRNDNTSRNKKQIEFKKKTKPTTISVDRAKHHSFNEINQSSRSVKPINRTKENNSLNITTKSDVNNNNFQEFKMKYNWNSNYSPIWKPNILQKWKSRNLTPKPAKPRQLSKSPNKKPILLKPEFKNPDRRINTNKPALKTKINISWNHKISVEISTKSTSRNSINVINKPQWQQSVSTVCSISTKSMRPILKKIQNIFSISKTGFSGSIQEKINQDNYFINKFEDWSMTYLGVCDGHGSNGHWVSEFVVEILPNFWYTQLRECNSVWTSTYINKCWEDAFIVTNSKLANNVNINSNFSGSTCVSLLLSNDCVYSANIGDSRAIKGQFHCYNNKWTYEQISRDHKPSDISENKRILRFGGRVEPFIERNGEFVGPKRVWWKGENIPGLAMSRSFGDQIASTVGVISEPELLCFPWKEEDKFIILASDGLFEYISNEEVLNTVVEEWYFKDKKNGDNVIDILYQKAKKKWREHDYSIDDITILLVVLE